MTITAPALGEAIVTNDMANTRFLEWMADITEAVNNVPPLTGTGAPSVAASVGRWYVDTSANAVYYKESGDGSSGWTLTT